MNSSPPARVAQYRIAETVAAELRSRILAGDGDNRLPTQDQLVTEFGVSYPSIREALRILETEGLVTVRRGNVGGSEVHRPDESSAAYHLGLALQARRVALGDLAASLRVLEPLCAAECARRSDRAEAVVPSLRENLKLSAELTGDGIAFTKTARDFHYLLAAANPNATLRHVVGSLVALWSAQEQAWGEVVTGRGEYPSNARAAALRAHQRIVDDIAAGRTDEAERVTRAHLRAKHQRVLGHSDNGIVTVSSVWARQAIQTIQSNRRERI